MASAALKSTKHNNNNGFENTYKFEKNELSQLQQQMLHPYSSAKHGNKKKGMIPNELLWRTEDLFMIL